MTQHENCTDTASPRPDPSRDETALELPSNGPAARTDSAQDVVLERSLVEQRAYRKLLAEARVDHVDLVGVRAWVGLGVRVRVAVAVAVTVTVRGRVRLRLRLRVRVTDRVRVRLRGRVRVRARRPARRVPRRLRADDGGATLTLTLSLSLSLTLSLTLTLTLTLALTSP